MKKLFDMMRKADIRTTIALVVVIGIFVILGVLSYHEIPVRNTETVQRAIDQILVLGFGMVIGYYFVASKKDKDSNQNSE